MAKKSRRRRSKARARAQQAPARIEKPPVAVQTKRATSSRASELAEEYRYVLSDLRRIGILAASMFALLVALALLAQYVF